MKEKNVLFARDGLSSLNTIIFSCVQFRASDMPFFCIDENNATACVSLCSWPSSAVQEADIKVEVALRALVKALWLPERKGGRQDCEERDRWCQAVPAVRSGLAE